MIQCDACKRPAVWVALISRLTKTRRPATPARFRLCSEHAEELGKNDPDSRFLPLGEMQ